MNRDELPVIALDVGGSSVKSGLVVDQQIVSDICVDVIQSDSTADVIITTLAAIITAGDNSTALSESFASFGKDLGEFLEPFSQISARMHY